MAESQQTRPLTADEQFRMLFDRTAKLNDAVSALLSPEWGANAGILPEGHPLHPGTLEALPSSIVKRPGPGEEQGAPADWQAIAHQRERELKAVGEARHRAEAAVEEARTWARHGYEIGQRHCSWSDYGVAPAWLTEGWPHHFDSCEHLKQACEYDEALTRVRALALAQQTEGEDGPTDAGTLWPSEVLNAINPPA